MWFHINFSTLRCSSGKNAVGTLTGHADSADPLGDAAVSALPLVVVGTARVTAFRVQVVVTCSLRYVFDATIKWNYS